MYIMERWCSLEGPWRSWGRAATMVAAMVAVGYACGCSPMVRKRGAGREKERQQDHELGWYHERR
jgi:hypothetical protein